MSINKNSTGYTFTFSIIMVVVVGVALAYTSLSLKPLQKANAADKQMMDVLGAIEVASTRQTAKVDFTKYVVERVALDYNGNVVSNKTGMLIQRMQLIHLTLTLRKITVQTSLLKVNFLE